MAYNSTVSGKQHQHFIIGGTIKAATSSLFNYFSAHPQVCGSRIKETFFFSQGYSGDIDQDYETYASYFSPEPDTRILFEASPNYLAYKENVAPRIQRLFPDIRLLFVLRNPVERLYSHFNFAKGKLELPVDMSFEYFVDLCEQFNKGQVTPAEAGVVETHLRAMEIGNYGRYLKNFYDVFDDENIKVIFFDELRTDPVAKLVEICEFIDLSPAFFEDFIGNKANVTYSAKVRFLHIIALSLNRMLEPVLRKYPGLKYRLVKIYKFFNQDRQSIKPMQEETRKKLTSYYAPSNAEVKNILGDQTMPSWID